MIGIASLLATAIASPVYAQDVIVMRRVVTPPVKVDGPVSAVWDEGDWISDGPACSDTAAETRAPRCMRADVEVEPSQCAEPKPDVIRYVPRYDACTYSWVKTSFGEWSSSCSDDASRPVLEAVCQRSDGKDAPGQCADANKPFEERDERLEGCTYQYVTGGWGPWSSTCSNVATRSQTVQCQRSDGKPIAQDREIMVCGVPKDAELRISKPTAVITNCSSILKNPSFANGLQNWTASGSAAHNTKNNTSADLTAIKDADGGSVRFNWSAGAVEQTVATQVGATYTLSWWSWQYSTSTVVASVNGVRTGNAQSMSNGNGAWYQFSGSFVAQSTSTLIRFSKGTPSGTTNLDNIILTQLPND